RRTLARDGFRAPVVLGGQRLPRSPCDSLALTSTRLGSQQLAHVLRASGQPPVDQRPPSCHVARREHGVSSLHRLIGLSSSWPSAPASSLRAGCACRSSDTGTRPPLALGSIRSRALPRPRAPQTARRQGSPRPALPRGER